jgi:hypothetical protein
MKKLKRSLSLCAIIILFFAGMNGNNNPNKFDCIGSIMKSGNPQSSCVLISSKYVLVMANALIDVKTKLEPIPGTNIIVNNPYERTVTDIRNVQIEFNGKVYNCEKFILYPEFIKDSLKSDCDIAIIKLKDVVTGITPATIYTSNNEKQCKLIATGDRAMVDYGSKNPSDKSGKLIDSLGGYQINNTPTQLFCKFGTHNFKNVDEWQKNDLLFNQTSDGWQLIGIGGGSVNGLTKEGKEIPNKTSIWWTRVSAFSDWIKQTMSQD